MKYKLAAAALLLGLWWIASNLTGKPFLPPPHRVFIVMLEEISSGELLLHLGISLGRVFAALFAAAIPAIALGISAGLNKKADALLSPMAYILFPIPKIALLPLILLFFGLGDGSKIFLVALIVFFPFYLNIRDEVCQINRKYFDSLKTLGGGLKQDIAHIVIPVILPRIFSTLRLTLGTGIAVLFLAETFATRSGIGWYIMDGWSRLSYEEMFAGIAALSIAGLVLFLLIDIAEKRFCRWKQV